MDFLDRVCDYLEQNLSLYTKIRVGILGSGDSIAIRPTPGMPPQKYLTGDRVRTYAFQVLTQHQSPKVALETLEAITRALQSLENGAIVSQDGSFVFVSCEAYTQPNFVEVTSQGTHVYSAIFYAEIFQPKEV